MLLMFAFIALVWVWLFAEYKELQRQGQVDRIRRRIQ